MKKLSLLLFAALLLASCSDTDAEKTQTTTDMPAATTEAADTIMDNLPDNLDFGGYEVRVFGSAGNTFAVTAEQSADVINDLIYKRNRAIEDRLNVTISSSTYTGNGWEVFVDLVNSSVMAGSDDYDIVTDAQWIATPLTFNNVLYNLEEAPYIAVDADWWATEYIKGYSYKDTYYWLTGPLDIGWIGTRLCNFVNLNLWDNLYDEDIYDIVENGQWTLDTLNTYGTDVYQDLNGNSSVDKGDRVGAAIGNDMPTELFVYAAGIRITNFDEEGVPQLAFTEDPEPLVNFWEKLYAIKSNPQYLPMVYGEDGLDNTTRELNYFKEGNLLFVIHGWLNMTASYLRDMEDDYGIIPFPKYDETQENYLCVIKDHLNLYGLPTTISETGRDASLAVLEAAAAEGYNTITPAYYDNALKNKYIRDERSIEIIDMLQKYPICDFGAQHTDLGFMNFIRYDVTGANIASVIERKTKTFEKTLSDLIESLEAAE